MKKSFRSSNICMSFQDSKTCLANAEPELLTSWFFKKNTNLFFQSCGEVPLYLFFIIYMARSFIESARLWDKTKVFHSQNEV